jgi:peptide/nickel transport system substrate-binding protein
MKASGSETCRLPVACCLLPVACCSFFLSAAAHAEVPPPVGGRAVASLGSAPGDLDPVTARSWTDVTLALLVFDSLYRLDASGRVVPHLAESLPQVSADGLEARVVLRQGARFHDGRAVRPPDVVASLRRAMAAPSTTWALAAVVAVTHAEGSLILKLRRPEPDLAARLALPQLAVTPLGRAPGRGAPIGSGPFRVRRIDDAARRVELEAAPDHFAGRPWLDALVLRWFTAADEEARGYEAGEADVSLRGAVAFAGHEPKYPTVAIESRATILGYLGFGRARGGMLEDPETRAAVSLAIGRAGLRHVGSGERVVPAASPVPVDLGGAAPTDATPAVARAAMARVVARYPKLARLEILVDASRPEDAEVAARIIAALDRVGLGATYVAVPAAELERRVAAGLCDLYLGELALPAADPLAAYAAAFAAGGDGTAAARLREAPLGVEQAAAMFAARLPIVPLFHRSLRVHHKRALRGLGVDALGRLSFADAYLWTGPTEVPAETP